MIEDRDILNYLHGNISDERRAQLELWISSNPANKKAFEFTKSIWKASLGCSTYSQFDTDLEWNDFQDYFHEHKNLTSQDQHFGSKIGEAKIKSHTPQIPAFASDKEGNALNFLNLISISAAVVAFSISTFLHWPQTSYVDINYAERQSDLKLDDGTIVRLDKGSSFKSLKSYKYSKERKVMVSGGVSFEVKKDVEKAFIVETKDAGISTFDGSFKVKTLGKATILDNENAKLKFYALRDDDLFVEVDSGEIFRFDQIKFIDTKQTSNDPKPTLEVLHLDSADESIQTQTMKEVVAHIIKISNGKAKFQSGMDINSDEIINIELPIVSVLEFIKLLENTGAIVNYKDNGCYNCVEFIEIIPSKK